MGKSDTPDKQGEKLSNCLNTNHVQKLSLEEMLFILRQAHKKGCHVGITFICRHTGYADPQPIVLEDEITEHERQFISAVAEVKHLAITISELRSRATN